MIPFNKPPHIGTEEIYVTQATENSNLCGHGVYTVHCQNWIENLMGNGSKVLLTTSCTTALELAALIIDIQPGDEVILPSFTFVSSVNAFVLRGAVPVMIDVEPDTMHMDHTNIEAAITTKTRAIVPVQYAGIGCEMDTIMALADKYRLMVIEDAAPSLTATYKSRALGSIGHIGCFSFHETKNITAGGQGGAIVVNDPGLIARAEILYDNGTNRQAFWRGEILEYGWIDVGSNFVMSEIQAAYLWAQLEKANKITSYRRQLWERYDKALRSLASAGRVGLAIVSPDCQHNAHMYFIKTADLQQRQAFAKHMKAAGVACVPHYVPLHHRPIFLRVGRFVGEDIHTTAEQERLIRLPLYFGLSFEDQDEVIAQVRNFFAPENEGMNGSSTPNGSIAR